MSTESLNRTSDIVGTPSQSIETPRVNVDDLKKKLRVKQKRQFIKNTIILFFIIIFFGVISLLIYQSL